MALDLLFQKVLTSDEFVPQQTLLLSQHLRGFQIKSMLNYQACMYQCAQLKYKLKTGLCLQVPVSRECQEHRYNNKMITDLTILQKHDSI